MGSRKGVLMKKILSLILALVVCSVAFAQASGGNKSVKKYLSPSDVDALVKNFDALGTDLDEYDEADALVGMESFMSPDFNPSTFLATMKSPPELDAVCLKHGLGKDGFRKLCIMIWAFMLSAYDAMLEEGAAADRGMDIVAIQPTMDALRASLNPADMSLVASRWDDLITVFGDPLADQLSEVSSDDETEETMTVDDFYGDDSGDSDEYDYDEDAEYDD